MKRTAALHVVTQPKRDPRPTIAQLRRAIRLYGSEYVSRAENKALRIKWLRSVALLGDKWLLAKPAKRSK